MLMPCPLFETALRGSVLVFGNPYEKYALGGGPFFYRVGVSIDLFGRWQSQCRHDAALWI